MTTKARFRNKYRLEVRERDHGPPHCHLVGGDVDILIELATLAFTGKWPAGLKAEVLAWVSLNLDDLWKEWNKWHT
jgi:hypothetical protein